MESESVSAGTDLDSGGHQRLQAPGQPNPLAAASHGTSETSQSALGSGNSQLRSGSPLSGNDQPRFQPAPRPGRSLAALWTSGWFWTGGYHWDWALSALLLGLSAVPGRLVQPAERFYPAKDPAMSYPHTEGLVSSPVLYTCVTLGPLLLFSLAQLWHRSALDWHHGALSLAEGLSLAFNVKRWLNLVGKYRPDWFARTASGLQGGTVAYPSGHAAYSFCAAVLMALYLLGKLRVFSRNSKGLFPKAVAALLPLVGAFFIAASRLTDYRHDFSDVNAGSCIGMACGGFAYFLNFPSLWAPNCARPRSRGSQVFYEDDDIYSATQDESSDETEVASRMEPPRIPRVGPSRETHSQAAL